MKPDKRLRWICVSLWYHGECLVDKQQDKTNYKNICFTNQYILQLNLECLKQ
jgi:hypothetical protein